MGLLHVLIPVPRTSAYWPGFPWVEEMFVPHLAAPLHIGSRSSWVQVWGRQLPGALQLWVHERADTHSRTPSCCCCQLCPGLGCDFPLVFLNMSVLFAVMGRASWSGMGLGFICHPSSLTLHERWHCPLLFGLCLLGVGFWAANLSPNHGKGEPNSSVRVLWECYKVSWGYSQQAASPPRSSQRWRHHSR